MSDELVLDAYGDPIDPSEAEREAELEEAMWLASLGQDADDGEADALRRIGENREPYVRTGDEPPPSGEAWSFRARPESKINAHELFHYGVHVGTFHPYGKQSALHDDICGQPTSPDDPRAMCEVWMRRAVDIARDLSRYLSKIGWMDAWTIAPAVVIDGGDDHPVMWCRSDGGAAGFMATMLPTRNGRACGQCPWCVSRDAAVAQNAARWVYFIQAGDGGPIKIGHTNNVQGRVATFQTGNPHRLEVLHKTPGGPALEAALHAAFAAHRLHGEWFKPAPEILRLIAEMKG